MKNKVTIKNAQGEYLQHVIFEDLSAQEAWLQMLHDTHAWGKPEYKVEISPEKVIEHEAIKAKKEVLDENGKVLEAATKARKAYVEKVEAVYEIIPSEYIVQVEDMTEELAVQAKIKEIENLKSTVTIEKLMEAVLTGNKSFLIAVDTEVKAKKAKI